MREVDEANRELQRARILDAAARCLEAKGVAKTSINDICVEAAMRPGHLYYYFPSKDAVFAGVAFRDRDYVLDLVEHMYDGPDIAAQIIDVHVKANKLRQSFDLSPITRLELGAYLIRIGYRHEIPESQNLARNLLGEITLATEAAIADGRLPKALNPVVFIDAVTLLWEGLSLSKIEPNSSIARLEQSAQFVLEVLLTAARSESRSGAIERTTFKNKVTAYDD